MQSSSSQAEIWGKFSEDYSSKVFAPTIFPERRARILRDALSGLVVDLGCGALGLILSDIARRPDTIAIGTDFSWSMINQSRCRTSLINTHYVVADHRALPFSTGGIDCIVTVNSILPTTRTDVDLVFAEIARVLRKGGRLIALLPAFEMSLRARDEWRMPIEVDPDRHRMWDTTGWQCFYTSEDICELMNRHRFGRFEVERMRFSASAERDHIRQVYAASLEQVPVERMVAMPLFEHLLVAES